MPALDLRTKPKARPAGAEVENRSRHVRIATLVLADGVALCQPEDASDLVGVDEVLKDDASGHES